MRQEEKWGRGENEAGGKMGKGEKRARGKNEPAKRKESLNIGKELGIHTCMQGGESIE